MSFPLFKTKRDFCELYEMPLQRVLFAIEKRGLCVDRLRLRLLHKHIIKEKGKERDEIKQLIGLGVITSEEERTNKSEVNIGAPAQLISLLQDVLKIKVPKNRQTGRETTDQEAIEQMFAETGHPVLRKVIRVRELNKIDGTYVTAGLRHIKATDQHILLTSYLATGTVGGRRSSRASFLGLGTNHQNLPKHSDLGRRFRRCLISRPGKIFISADLKGAEDWIVHGTIADQGGSLEGINELRAGINRHRKTASFVFCIPEQSVSKSGLEYYLAKRSRHGFNYGMMGRKQARILAAEGISVVGSDLMMQDGRKMRLPAEYIAVVIQQNQKAPKYIVRQGGYKPNLEGFCQFINDKIDFLEPQIRGVYQKHVEETLRRTRQLTTPIGRIRDFLSLRPYSDNGEVYRDGFSYIPQSTVGDLTGLAILFLEQEQPGFVLVDGHDAIIGESDNDLYHIRRTINDMKAAYDTEVVFANGFSLEIPIEFELGYNLGEMLSWDESSGETGLRTMLDTLNRSQNRRQCTTGGPPQQSLELHSSDTCGTIEGQSPEYIQTYTPS